MSRESRTDLIRGIEEARGAKLIVYITGDRRGMETKIANDIFPMFHRHLMHLGFQDKIDLFLYSTGGLTIAGYALVNLLREFCDELNVIIPFKALSCATLIALGANEIVMTPMAQLSPIDPSTEHPLGPVATMPGQPAGRIVPISVEDVNAFIGLAKKELKLKEENSLLKVFELLSEKIHPLALGAVQRSREQIEFLSKALMKLHTQDGDEIDEVINTLTRKRFSHDYIVSRKEAKENLKLNIIDPGSSLTRIIVDLYNEYNELLELDTPYHPETVLSSADSGVFTFYRGIIESSVTNHVFRTIKDIKRVQMPVQAPHPPVIGYQERLLEEGWFKENAI